MPTSSSVASSRWPRQAAVALRLRLLTPAAGIALGCLIAGIPAGFFIGQHFGFKEGANRRRESPDGSVLCKPGPWGDLSYTPFNIAAPDDLIPVGSIEANGTQWFLKGYSAESFVALLQSTSLPPEKQRAFLDPAVLHVRPDGIELTPPPDLVFSLPQDALSRLYPLLAQFPENEAQVHFLHVNSLGDRFSGSGVSEATMALFKRLCFRRGSYLMFSGLPALLSRLPAYEDKLRFVKALTRERTMMLRLHITPKTNVGSLAEYWGKGCWGTDVRTLLQSLTEIPTGTWMSVLMVLPPLPSEQIYNYPTITDNPLKGPLVNRDCHWTSLNFFRDMPDPNFGKAEYVMRELKDNYYPVPGDPRYGDVVLFVKPDGSIIHSAVYIADDICFTKNGSTAVHPWMLSTVSDLLDQYSFQVDEGRRLTVNYFRSKEL